MFWRGTAYDPMRQPHVVLPTAAMSCLFYLTVQHVLILIDPLPSL